MLSFCCTAVVDGRLKTSLKAEQNLQMGTLGERWATIIVICGMIINHVTKFSTISITTIHIPRILMNVTVNCSSTMRSFKLLMTRIEIILKWSVMMDALHSITICVPELHFGKDTEICTLVVQVCTYITDVVMQSAHLKHNFYCIVICCIDGRNGEVKFTFYTKIFHFIFNSLTESNLVFTQVSNM